MAQDDRAANAEEVAAIDDETVDAGVREHYQRAAARGVRAKGEGRIP